MLNEYIVAAGLQRGQRLFESVNALGTAVTVELLTPTTPGMRFGSGKAAGFLSPVGCHTWQRPASTIYPENDGRLHRLERRGDIFKAFALGVDAEEPSHQTPEHHHPGS
jgi:hypothetical protein